MKPSQIVEALRVECPRCDAVGYVVPSTRGPYFEVLWGDADEVWIDGLLHADELARSTYGCGYCPEKSHKAELDS